MVALIAVTAISLLVVGSFFAAFVRALTNKDIPSWLTGAWSFLIYGIAIAAIPYVIYDTFFPIKGL